MWLKYQKRKEFIWCQLLHTYSICFYVETEVGTNRRVVVVGFFIICVPKFNKKPDLAGPSL